MTQTQGHSRFVHRLLCVLYGFDRTTEGVKFIRPRIRLIFRWYDFWIGAYWDHPRSVLYVFPIPMLGMRIELRPRAHLWN